jgi:stage III sporulation protein AD
MVEIVSVAGFCITASVLCKIIEKYNKEQAAALSVAGISAVMLTVCSLAAPVLSSLNSIFEAGGIESENIQIIFKALGISYITQLAVDICRDCGESALASSAETAGKILILTISLPLFSELVSIVSGLL